MSKVNPEHIRAFALRDRAPVARLKRRHWDERRRREGPLAALRAAHALYAHACRVRPGFPGERARSADLAHQVELKRLIDQASRALAIP